MTRGWAPRTRPCCSAACSAAMHSRAANQPELNRATHWRSVTMNMASTASKLSVQCPQGCYKAKVGSRLSRFAVKQMYITYWVRHLSLIQTRSGWLVHCRRPAVIKFWYNVCRHFYIRLFPINHKINFCIMTNTSLFRNHRDFLLVFCQNKIVSVLIFSPLLSLLSLSPSSRGWWNWSANMSCNFGVLLLAWC